MRADGKQDRPGEKRPLRGVALEVARAARALLIRQPGEPLAGELLRTALDLVTVGGLTEEPLSSEVRRLILRVEAIGELMDSPDAALAGLVSQLSRYLEASEPSERAVAAPRSAPSTKTAPSSQPVPAAPAPRPPHRTIIDGSNVLGSAEGYMLGDPESQERLTVRVQQLARRSPARQFLLYFDGGKVSVRRAGNVEVRTSSSDHEADDALVAELHRLPAAERRLCRVVTDDAELRERCTRLGASTAKVGEFVAELEADRPDRDAGLNYVPRGRVGEWEQFFSRPPQRPGRKKGAR